MQSSAGTDRGRAQIERDAQGCVCQHDPPSDVRFPQALANRHQSATLLRIEARAHGCAGAKRRTAKSRVARGEHRQR